MVIRIILFFNFLAIIALLLAYGAPYINPNKFWPISFFGLAYPIILLVNISFILLWLLIKIRYSLLSLIFVLLGYQFIGTLFALNIFKKDEKHPSSINLLSFNVQNFGLYDWKNNQKIRDEMFKTIENEKAQIICFQDFYHADEAHFENIKFIKEQMGLKHHYFNKTLSLRGKNYWGLSIFTSYPIVKEDAIKFPNTMNTCIYTDIKIKEDTIRVYNVHLQSIRFEPADYKYIEDISVKQNPDMLSSRKILRKLKYAYKKRGEQVDLVTENIKSCPYPYIICGDFNDSPISYAYHELSKNMQDAFIKKGVGVGQTYSGPFPSFRIDYILMDEHFEIHDFSINKDEKHSDHYPILANFSIKSKKE